MRVAYLTHVPKAKIQVRRSRCRLITERGPEVLISAERNRRKAVFNSLKARMPSLNHIVI